MNAMAPLMTSHDSPPKCTVTICCLMGCSATLITHVHLSALYLALISMLCLILEAVMHLDAIGNITDVAHDQYHATECDQVVFNSW